MPAVFIKAPVVFAAVKDKLPEEVTALPAVNTVGTVKPTEVTVPLVEGVKLSVEPENENPVPSEISEGAAAVVADGLPNKVDLVSF